MPDPPAPPRPPTAERGAALLRLARAALDEAIVGAPRAWADALGEVDAPWLEAPGASFVTLRRGTDLRGCVGSLEARRPLRRDVRENAIAAATRDPRFPPVGAGELAALRLEVSLLGRRELVDATSEAAVLEALRPGVDGVALSWRRHRATYLPQVWDQLPEPADFLASLRRKAGLREDFWHPAMRLERYRAEKWREP